MPSMGMDKSGTQVVPLSTWTKITGWTVRSGYPSTVITSDTLAINATGGGNIRFRGQFNAALGTQQFRVVRNGTTVLGSPANASVTTTINSITVSPGDTLELQGFASTNGWNTVSAGSEVTFLEWNQTTSNYDITATQTIGWSSAAALAVDTSVTSDQTIVWDRTAALSFEYGIAAAQTIGWSRTADLYLGQYYDVEAAQTIGWTSTADLLLIPKVVSPPSVFAFTEVSASIHTADGRAVGDIPCNIVGSFQWRRESTETSGATLEVFTEGDPQLMEELRQWVHWLTIWHDDTPVWTGPIWSIRLTRARTTITARDASIFMWRTRVPITRTFADTAPARIADPLWRSMLQLHGIRTTPVVLPGVAESTFTISAQADSKFLYQLMDEIVRVGLVWTVVAGRPVLGTFPREAVAELYECDFMVELERLRDGSTIYNDVRVQSQNSAATAVVPLAGLHLQNLLSMDDLRGASNTQRAALHNAQDSARLRDDLVIPSGASLHPQAPVTLEDLIPGKVIAVHYEDISQLMRLDAVVVSGSPEQFDVQISLVALEPTDDSATLEGGSNA